MSGSELIYSLSRSHVHVKIQLRHWEVIDRFTVGDALMIGFLQLCVAVSWAPSIPRSSYMDCLEHASSKALGSTALRKAGKVNEDMNRGR